MSDLPLLALDETLERMSGDRALLMNLFELFQVDAPKKMAEIRRQAELNDFYQVERLAHSLKGASATVGASVLCALAIELEQAAKAHDSNRIAIGCEEIQTICSRTLEAMAKFCAGVSSSL